MRSEEELTQTTFTDVPRLDIERICLVLIRIATYLEGIPYEDVSTQKQEQLQHEPTIDGMASS